MDDLSDYPGDDEDDTNQSHLQSGDAYPVSVLLSSAPDRAVENREPFNVSIRD
jgi:hypothetical protein